MRLFQNLQQSCCVKRGKVSGTISEAIKLGDELVKKVGESRTQVANIVTPGTQPAVETEIVSLPGKLKKAREEAVSATVELNAVCAATQSDTKEHNVALAKVRGERQEEVEA